MLKKKHDIFYPLWILYGLFSLYTLELFPRIHSDEAWLSGLSYALLQKKELFLTEPYFDLFPRQMHSFKLLYHLLLTLPISLFGNRPFSIRILSLIFTLASLVLLYLLFKKRYKDSNLALLFAFAIGLNLQVIYASHFGRQEALLFFLLILGHSLYEQQKSPILIASLIGLGIALHPNGFIIAAMIGILYLLPFQGKKLLAYCLTLLLFLSFYLSINVWNNADFFADYWAYGKTLSVDAAPINRFKNLLSFFQKIRLQEGGTYEFVNLNVYFSFALILIPLYLYQCIQSKRIPQALLLSIAYIASIFIIGRYNTTSILFLIYPLYLLFFDCTFNFPKQLHKKIIFPMIGLLLLYSLLQIKSNIPLQQDNTYSIYENEISPYLIKDKGILGNLSCGFLLSDYSFYDIRNLAYLDQGNFDPDKALEQYLNQHQIETILFYEEYDYIHRNPEWNILYGEDDYYLALKEILEKDYLLVHEFESPIYGTRIIRYRDGYPWKVQIYQKRLSQQESR